jgi:hypothetical protein
VAQRIHATVRTEDVVVRMGGAALDLTEERELADFGATTGSLRAAHN